MNRSAPQMQEQCVRTWIFQANPSRYRILDSLRLEDREYWNVRQYAAEIKPGDRVLVWISGEDAGIYAKGTVRTSPQVMEDSAAGQKYWSDAEEKRRARARVLVEYEFVFLDRPLGKKFLASDPYLANLSILRNPRGTNFKVTDSEWEAIQMWLEDL